MIKLIIITVIIVLTISVITTVVYFIERTNKILTIVKLKRMRNINVTDLAILRKFESVLKMTVLEFVQNQNHYYLNNFQNYKVIQLAAQD